MPGTASHKSVVQVMSEAADKQYMALWYRAQGSLPAEISASETCSSCKRWWQWSLLSLFADGLALLAFNLSV